MIYGEIISQQEDIKIKFNDHTEHHRLCIACAQFFQFEHRPI